MLEYCSVVSQIIDEREPGERPDRALLVGPAIEVVIIKPAAPLGSVSSFSHVPSSSYFKVTRYDSRLAAILAPREK